MRALLNLLLILSFTLGWNWGMAQTEWHKWWVAPMAAYMCGAVIRFIWMTP